MSKALKWLETEGKRLEKECDTNDDPFKTVNHSFIQGFNYALANVELNLKNQNSTKISRSCLIG
ncbi:hypothetical protein MXE74_13820 [Enterococcus faecalis]|uniref:hypothetical protein n=1 Tax=Enterococcus faecalis TaxID=1351 RepID=UPI002DBEDCB0|nr:hypothetical protein [Enterococcus faecalis]MEB5927615.1 hypothetical protein [Enterococcus faecalis]